MGRYSIRMDGKHEASHTAIIGDTGVGKTAAINQKLLQVEERGETAVIWDADRIFAPLYYNKERGDVLLDPGLADCPYWPVGEEVQDEADAASLAESMFPEKENSPDQFFNPITQKVFAYLLATIPGLDTAHLAYLLAHDQELLPHLKGTEFEATFSEAATNQYAGLVANLNKAAQPMRMMPATFNGRCIFTMRGWSEHRKGWIFICSKSSHSAALRPLHSMWVSYLIKRLIDMGPRPDLPAVRLIIDEASSLNLQGFHEGLVRLRKTGCSITYGIQNYCDLQVNFGGRAQAIFSQPYSKLFFRCSDPESAQRLADAVGKNVIERLDESVSYSKGRPQKSYRQVREEVYQVPAGELKNLPDLHAYLLVPGMVTKIKLPYTDLSYRRQILQERVIPSMDRRPLDPEAPRAQEPEVSADEVRSGPSKKPAKVGPKKALRKAMPNQTLAFGDNVIGINLAQFAPKPNEFVAALQEKMRVQRERMKELNFPTDPSCYEGPPLTRFVCSDCKHVQDFVGALDNPDSTCEKCGGAFASTPSGEFYRNTVMTPHLKNQDRVN